jgi:hypothetical protein
VSVSEQVLVGMLGVLGVLLALVGSLLTDRDWKTMYEAQERDLAALRQEREEAMSLLRKLIDQARGEK